MSMELMALFDLGIITLLLVVRALQTPLDWDSVPDFPGFGWPVPTVLRCTGQVFCGMSLSCDVIYSSRV